jgi:hypothetical protein
MAYELVSAMWITEDGSYGQGQIILTDPTQFSEEQLETLDNLGDNSKFDFAYAALNGQDTTEWED